MVNVGQLKSLLSIWIPSLSLILTAEPHTWQNKHWSEPEGKEATMQVSVQFVTIWYCLVNLKKSSGLNERTVGWLQLRYVSLLGDWQMPPWYDRTGFTDCWWSSLDYSVRSSVLAEQLVLFLIILFFSCACTTRAGIWELYLLTPGPYYVFCETREIFI